MTKPIGALYTAREQNVVLKALLRERGQGWARDLPRARFNAELRAALVARYGDREVSA